MDTPERSSRSYSKRWDVEDTSERKSDRVGEEEEWEEAGDKRKHRSSRSRKLGNGDEGEGVDGDTRRPRGLVGDGRRRSGGDGWSGRVESDEDDYESRKELRSKQMKKKQEESSLEQLSTWYQDGGGEKAGGGRGHGWVGDDERRKMASKVPENDRSSKEERSPSRRRVMSKASEHESSHNGNNKGKEERFHDGDLERTADRDSGKYAERKDGSREKGHNSVEMGRSSRRRWDEADNLAVMEDNLRDNPDSRSRKDSSDYRYDSSRERDASSRIQEPGDGQDRVFDSSDGKRVKNVDKEDKRVDIDRTKSKGRAEDAEEDSRGSSVAREDGLGRDKNQKHRAQKNAIVGDGPEGRESYSNADEDDNTWTRDRAARDVGLSDQHKSPERSVRRYQEPQHSEVESERGVDLRRKDIEQDGYREDKGKVRDSKWSNGKRDWEHSQENWKRRPPSGNDRESRDGDSFYDRGKDREPRHVRERNDNERPHGRSRGEAVKTSSNFGISHDDYDVIEIQTKPLDYGRADSGSNLGKRTGFGPPFDAKSAASEDWGHTREERARRHDTYVSASSVEAAKRYPDNGVMEDPSMWRDDIDNQGGSGRGHRGAATGRSSEGPGSQSPYGNQEPGYFGRHQHQGVKGNRGGRGGRGRPGGRDSQPVGLPLPMMGSPFVPVAMPPPGPLQPLVPGMSPAPGPPISPGVFIPPFPVWPGSRGVEMNMLNVPPAHPPVPSGPRFPPTIGTPPSNPAMFFNQPEPGPGLGRGVPPNIPGPGFNVAGPAGRGTPPDKAQGGWAPPRSSGPPGKAPSRGEQNDYSQNFVDTGMRPQNFIRELELTNVVEDYPKLRDLIQKKDEIVVKSASAPMYLQADLKEFELSPEFFGTKFDVILVDPPWEEYVHRAPGVADHMEYWTFDEILSLKIEAIADTPSFIFLWVGDGVGLEQGRQCLKKWGFRRCEDICWVKTNKNNATPGLRHDSHTLFQHSKEHCLMGIKGTVRRSTDGHIIHANIDTDVIIAEEPPYGSTQKPEDMYRIIEHFALGRRRLELFGEDHNIRSGWLTVGKQLSSTNFNSEAYIKNFADKDGKVWQGGGGRNPPPEAPHLVVTTPEIEALRPKSPMKNQQQIQPQQSASISLTTPNSSNRRPSGNSPQNPSAFGLNQESSSANLSTLPPWASPMEIFGQESGNLPLGGHDF